MKKSLYFSVLVFCFLSCNTKEKYQGHWTNWFLKDIGYNATRSVIIENDSIKFNYPYFDFWNKYPLIIEKGTFKFNGIALKATIEKDTLTFNDSIHFVKDGLDTLYGYKPILKIDLPQIQELIKTNEKDDDIINFVYFGERLDNGKFSLQLNDKYAYLKDLSAFLTHQRIRVRYELIPFFSTFLFIDKTTPMKFIEDIFHNSTIVNQLKVCFVNDIHLKHNDSIGIYYEYQNLVKRLPSFRENDNYNTNTSTERYAIPPPPPISFPMFDDTNPEPKFIFLKKDTIYFNNKTIKSSDLKTLVKPWIENNDAIFSLYDLESTYGHFLKMTAIIDSVYEDVREQNSKTKFNKTLKELTREEYDEIKMQIRMQHIWSYSIPHYNYVVQQENSFFGLKVN